MTGERGAGHAPSLSYRPALDGLRAVAVIAVMIFHGASESLPGGWLGVDLFFVISGFLITTLLLTERDRWGSTDFVSFWAGRARRLFPALAVMIAVVLVLSSVLTMPVRRPAIGSDALSAIGYIANWNFLSGGEAYFGAVTEPSPLLHTWSLAVEEQFYIIFPFVVVVLTTFCGRRMRAVVLAAAACASAAWMAYLFDPALPPDRVYYGTDTRAHELLIGAACAALLLIDDRVTRRVAAVCRRLAVPAALVVVAAFVWWDETRAFTFRGGLAIFAVLSAIVLVACWTRSPGRLMAFLSSRPMRSIGVVSYGLYLWHWPVMVFLDEVRMGFGGVVLLLLQLALTGVLAAASYRWIEMPIRRNGWSALIPRDRQAARVVVVAAVPALVIGAIVMPQSNWYVRPISASTSGGDVRVDAAAPAVGAAPLTLYLIGDSVPAGLTGYFPADQHPNITIRSSTTPSCHDPFPGLRVLNGNSGEDFKNCPDFVRRLGGEIAAAQPDVVAFFVTQSMVFDRKVDDRVIAAGTPEYRRFITRSLTELQDRVMSSGAKHFAVVTQSCHQLPAREGEYVERLNDTDRVRWINDVAVDWARAKDVPVIDQFALLCSGGFHDTINGRQMYEDYIHFSREGAREFWKWLAPKLTAVAGGTG